MALRPPESLSPDAPEPHAQATAEQVGRAYGHLLVPRTAQLEVGLYVSFLGIGALGVAVTLFAVHLGPTLGARIGAIGFVVFLLVGLAVWLYLRWEFLTGGTKSDLAAFPAPNHRVWSVGSPAGHARLQAMGAVEDAPFEPEVFAAPFALRAGWWTQSAWVAAAAAIYGALYLILPLLGFPLTNWFDLSFFIGSLAAGAFLVAAIRPTSIRIVPGRIDIMRGWFFQSSRPVVRSIPLRDRRVVMDLRSGIVFATDSITNYQADATVAFGTPRHRARIAHAVLRAAISTAQPPPLPDDAPVG